MAFVTLKITDYPLRYYILNLPPSAGKTSLCNANSLILLVPMRRIERPTY